MQKAKLLQKENLKYTQVLMQTCMHQAFVQVELNQRKMARKKGLRQWVRDKWVDIANRRADGSFPPCGRSKGEKRKKYPKCVPLAKARSMSAGKRRAAVARKQAKSNRGPRPSYAKT